MMNPNRTINLFQRNNQSSSDNSNAATLWERIGSDEFAELQHVKQVNESLQSRINQLERINYDLEHRLEDQAKSYISAEKSYINNEKEWNVRYKTLEDEIVFWKKEHESQRLKSDRLREHLSRTEREMYGILQRKYEFMRGATPNTGRSNQIHNSSSNSSGSNSQQSSQIITSSGLTHSIKTSNTTVNDSGSSRDLLDYSNSVQSKQPQKIREKIMITKLSDFLGL